MRLMKNHLIVYYSRTGTSEKVAQKLQERLECEMERVTDKINRKGASGYIRAGKEALSKQVNKLIDVQYNPADYHQIIFITPIWANRASTPIYSYWHAYKDVIHRYSIITVSGTSDGDGIVKTAETILKSPPTNTQFLYTKQVKKGDYILEGFHIL